MDLSLHRPQYSRRKTLFIFFLLFSMLLIGSFAPTIVEAQPYSISQIPNPKTQGKNFYVSNPDGIVSSATEAELNGISTRIENLTNAEYAIVLVDDFEGGDDFNFAFDLFNNWGIGKSGANNGLLLFIAKEQRSYRFISGTGIEGIFTDYYLGRMGREILVPHFRKEDYDQGVLEVSKAIERVFTAPDAKKELAQMMPQDLPFFHKKNVYFKNSLLVLALFSVIYLYIFFVEGILTGEKNSESKRPLKKKKGRTSSRIGKGCTIAFFLVFFGLFSIPLIAILNEYFEIFTQQNAPYLTFAISGVIISLVLWSSYRRISRYFSEDKKDHQKKMLQWTAFMFLPILIIPLVWPAFLQVGRTVRRNQGRFDPPDDSGNWERINRTSIPASPKKFLDAGQLKEEILQTVSYEIWKNTATGSIKTIPWGHDKKYYTCPDCGYYTCTKEWVVLKKATYSSKGEKEQREKCKNCAYYNPLKIKSIPKKVRSSSSGSSSSGGGWGSSSGGGSSSFGGGASSGGGAGGRW